MKIKRLVSILLCVMMLAMGASAALAEDTIKIGHITPLTGAIAAYGVAVSNGVNLAAAEINAAGGVLGKQIEVITKDNQFDVAETVSAFNTLLGEDVVAMIGAIASSRTAAITSLANDEGIVLITATSTADAITTEDDYVFRACFKDSFQGKMCAAFAADQGWTKAAILYANGDAYSSGLRDAFVAAAPDYGIEIVAEQSTSDTQAVDFSSQLATITASGAEVLFAPYYYDTVGPKIIPQAREAGFEGAIVGADGFDGTEAYAVGDLAAYSDVYFTNHYSPEDPAEKVQNFIAAYSEAYDPASLNALAALAYDAMYMVADAIETAGSTDLDAIRDAMAGMHYVGVTGDMTLDETGTPSKSVAILTFAEKDGALVQKFVTSQN